MALLVDNLIDHKNEPVCVFLGDSISVALDKMLENDFSQLPVIDEQNIPIGLVTYQGITRALMYRSTPIEKLSVLDVREELNRSQIFRADDELSDALDRLRDTYVILIVDAHEKLIGIVTTYDSTEYFRARSEDLLNVRDIETTIKDLLRIIFQQEEDEPDNEKVRGAVRKITSANQISKKDYAKALTQYLMFDDGREMNQIAMAQSYDLHINNKSDNRLFSELTLHDYIELLLHKDQSEHFQKLFNHPPDEIRKLLENVRDTRNDLAHFRDITPVQRDQLAYSKKQLDRLPSGIPVEWPAHKYEDPAEVIKENRTEYNADVQQITPVDEEILPRQSKYTPLIYHLQNSSGKEDRIKLTFDEINSILDGQLPPSARTHKVWWANDSVGHVQSQLWLEAGWRTSFVNMLEETVVFTRIIEQEKRYIAFFSEFLEKLKNANIPIKENLSVHGRHYFVFYHIPANSPVAAVFGVSFTKNKQFRIELYIDTKDKQMNKAIFDSIQHNEDVIAEKISFDLTWERIDEKKASRIAVYHPGHITDPDEKLAALQNWAIPTIKEFYGAILDPALTAIDALE